MVDISQGVFPMVVVSEKNYTKYTVKPAFKLHFHSVLQVKIDGVPEFSCTPVEGVLYICFKEAAGPCSSSSLSDR